MATAERQLYNRNKLVASLLRIHHDDSAKKGIRPKRDNVTKLKVYLSDALPAAIADPELFAHFVAWNYKNGKVRDAWVAFPPIALRGLDSGATLLAENAVAHMLLLSPRDLLRSYDFSKLMTKEGAQGLVPSTTGFAQGLPVPGGHRRLLERGLNLYLEAREQNRKWFDATAVQHRRALKWLYRAAHKKPSGYAQRVLFDENFPRGSVFEKIRDLRHMTNSEAAAVILQYQIPYDVAVGSVLKASDPSTVLALIEAMTGNQVITNTKMLQRRGVMNDPALKSAYESALNRARTDKKTEVLKAGRAAEAVGEDSELGTKLTNVQRAKLQQLGTIEGDWLVLGDISTSMQTSIELARRIASLIAGQVAGAVYLVFFNEEHRFFDVTGLSYDEIFTKTRLLQAQGNTSIAVGLDYIRTRKLAVGGIAIASDGGENRGSFALTYKRYCEEIGVEPNVYLFHLRGDHNVFTGNCLHQGIQVTEFEMGANVDYASLPNIVSTMRTNRYALFDEVMDVPLLTINEALTRGDKK